jgi:hypothetical protein
MRQYSIQYFFLTLLWKLVLQCNLAQWAFESSIAFARHLFKHKNSLDKKSYGLLIMILPLALTMTAIFPWARKKRFYTIANVLPRWPHPLTVRSQSPVVCQRADFKENEREKKKNANQFPKPGLVL